MAIDESILQEHFTFKINSSVYEYTLYSSKGFCGSTVTAFIFFVFFFKFDHGYLFEEGCDPTNLV